MSKAKRIEVLEQVQAQLSLVAACMHSLEMQLAAALEQAHAEAEDPFPLDVYEAACAEGAIVDEWPEDRAWTEEDEREAIETERMLRGEVR